MARKNEKYLFYNMKRNRFRLQTKFFSHSPHRQRQSDSRDFSADEHSHWLRPILFKLNWRLKVVWRSSMLMCWAFLVNWVRYSGMSSLIAKLSLHFVGSHSIALRIRVDRHELRRYDDSTKNVLHSTQALAFFHSFSLTYFGHSTEPLNLSVEQHILSLETKTNNSNENRIFCFFFLFRRESLNATLSARLWCAIQTEWRERNLSVWFCRFKI